MAIGMGSTDLEHRSMPVDGATPAPRAPTLADLRRRREELLCIAAEHGAYDIRVFGSVARGQARPDSDVDFLVELYPGRTVLDLSGLILDLQDALGRRVDVVEIRRPASSAAAERILREAVPL
jgi:predicted nucleotidyltransferase